MAVMLYKKGVAFVWEGLHLATKIVDEAEVEAHKLLGWVSHPHETIEVPETEPEAGAAPEAVAVSAAEAQTQVTDAASPVGKQVAAVDAMLNAAPVNPFAPKG